MRVAVSLMGMLALLVCACGEELGECDQVAAEELVYGRGGLVATKGQALMHDSCGNAAFCHSASAKDAARYGAPHALDFDMLPAPTGWPTIVDDPDAVWSAVNDGAMPPIGASKSTRGDGDWLFDAERKPGATKLPALATDAGKAALRNWLACGAPIVGDTRAPDWWVSPPADGGPVGSDWSDIYDRVIGPSCAIAGCHNLAAAGDLAMIDACSAYDELRAASTCGEPRLSPNDTGSVLVDKLSSKTPQCGELIMPPPPFQPLPASDLAMIRAWVEAGAPAEECQ